MILFVLHAANLLGALGVTSRIGVTAAVTKFDKESAVEQLNQRRAMLEGRLAMAPDEL
ncbi:hypothetical protein [Pseudomonas chlororaphis]|uniref:hypothetical protein n=1 Tax=Pseudomonas chlororaphis TaxID=587753 RepID=UPI0039DF6631